MPAFPDDRESVPHRAFARATFLSELQRAAPEILEAAQQVQAEERGRDADGVNGADEEERYDLVREWQEAVELDDPSFDVRLAIEHLDRAHLRRLLEARDAVAASVTRWPAWQETLRAALGRVGTELAIAPASEEPLGFASAVDAFVAVGWEAVRTRAPSIPAGVELEVHLDALAASLQGQLRALLLRWCEPTLVLELNVADLEERLEGDAPEARRRHYVKTLLRRPAEWEKLFDEYHGLARLMCTAMQRWTDAVCEVFGHLASDFPRLAKGLLRSGQPLRLVELTGALSDPQRGGRCAWTLTFAPQSEEGDEEGARLRIVYKPRAVAVDTHFQGLLAFCNEGARQGALRLEGDAQPFRLLRVLDGGGHGWVEHVVPSDCEDTTAVERFYARQGAYLAVLYVMGGVDVSLENVIACGEHPVLVDVESLFQATRATSSAEDAHGRVEEKQRDSVLRTGLVHDRAWMDPGTELGELEDDEPGRDRARGDHLPRVDGIIVTARDHTTALVAGFEATLRFLMAQREALQAAGGPLAACARDEVRYLLRSTAVYRKLLAAGRHPDRMRDLLEREQALDLLWRLTEPASWGLVPREKEDLRLGDVPYFSARMDERHLRTSHGEELRDFFSMTPMESVAARLRALDEREIVSQVFIVRLALEAVFAWRPTTGAREDLPSSIERGPEPSAPTTSTAARSIDAARSIGELLARTAIEGRDDAAWIGSSGATSAFELGPATADLYGGTAGTALFLAFLGHITHEDRFTRLAERAARATRRAFEGSAGTPSGDVAGGFAGSTSQLYVLSQLAVLWGDRALLPPLDAVRDRLAMLTLRDDRFDVMHGAAGRTLVLLTLYEATGDESLLALAAACGHQLTRLARGQQEEQSTTQVVWKAADGRALMGFSHGSSGIALALSRLAHALAPHGALGRDAAGFRRLADAAFSFERRCFDAPADGGPDLHAGRSWCHGAPGMALARVVSPSLATDETTRREAEIAIENTLAGPVRTNPSLCHGELGNLMIVARAAAALNRPDWWHQVEQRWATTLTQWSASRSRRDFDFPLTVPALMNGIAGVGYGFLYLAHPSAVPHVLALAPSSAGGRA